MPHLSCSLDGDNHADLIWRNTATGQNAVWMMSGAAIAGQAALTTVAGTGWQISAVGDVNADGKADLIWRHALTGQTVVWLMNGSSMQASSFLAMIAGVNWEIVRD